MNISDQIEDAKMGNAAAQKLLFSRLADPMMSLCCRYVKNREDAEEILLDGFCKVFSPLSGFRYQGEAALYAWIKRIMVNECLMFLRRRHSFAVVSETEAEGLRREEEPRADPPAARIFHLMVRLPGDTRPVF